MNQESYLKEITEKFERGEISKDEFILLIQNINQNKLAKYNFLNNLKILYIPGVLILIFGILALVSQFWFLIGFFGRISITLILGLIFAGVGSALLIQKPQDRIGSIFHVVGGILIFFGSNVFLGEIINSFNFLKPEIVLFLAFSLFYLLLFLKHKSQVLFFFTIFFISIFLFSLFREILLILNRGDYLLNQRALNYFLISLGSSYLLLSYAVKSSFFDGVKRFLNFFGIFFILSSIYYLLLNSIFWQVLYAFVLISAIYISTILRSTAILILSNLFFIFYLGYITGEYFADSVGWPFSLIIIGFVTIGLVFLSANLFQKYINKPKI